MNKINLAPKEWDYENNLSVDLYDCVNECNTDDTLKPPPAYKTTIISEQKHRYQSLGKTIKGNVDDTTKKKYTSNDYNTEVKYHSNYELKYYSFMT